jgi:hypothetical protein
VSASSASGAAELSGLTLLELAERLGAKEVSSVEATRACLERVAAVDGKVKAFLRVDERGALAAAEASDQRRRKGAPASPLDGVPVGLKDIFLTEGLETTCGSKILEGFIPPYDGTVVRLLKQAGDAASCKAESGRCPHASVPAFVPPCIRRPDRRASPQGERPGRFHSRTRSRATCPPQS